VSNVNVEQIDARTVGDLKASDLGAQIAIPDMDAAGTLLAVEHYVYGSEALTDVSMTRHGGMVMRSTTSCEVTR
jgi:hypothetical protein